MVSCGQVVCHHECPMVAVLHSYIYIYTKVFGHPFKWVDLSISAIHVADRCIKVRAQISIGKLWL